MNSPSRTLVPLAALALVGYILFQVHHILLPFVLAATISYLLHPLIRLFEVRGLKHRPVALTLIDLFPQTFHLETVATLERI